MVVKLEKRTSRWRTPLVLAGIAGISGALLGYYTTLHEAPASPRDIDSGGKIRVPLFIDPSRVRPTPRFRFTFDPPEALAELRANENLDEVVQGASDDREVSLRLMHWARRQWDPGLPNPYPPLDARIILRDIRRGFTSGFCAQYNYVLAQALQSFGIPARYVSLVGHEVIEARLSETGGWACLDPLYDAAYTGESGQLLSVYEVHLRVGEGRSVNLTEGHRVEAVEEHLRGFTLFAVWLKNDHVTSPLNFTDIERYKVYFVEETAGTVRIPPGALTTSEPLDLYPG